MLKYSYMAGLSITFRACFQNRFARGTYYSCSGTQRQDVLPANADTQLWKNDDLQRHFARHSRDILYCLFEALCSSSLRCPLEGLPSPARTAQPVPRLPAVILTACVWQVLCYWTAPGRHDIIVRLFSWRRTCPVVTCSAERQGTFPLSSTSSWPFL